MEDSGPRRLGLLALGIVAVSLLWVGLAAWFLVPTFRGGEDPEVPSLVGRTLEEARQAVGEDFKLVGDGEPQDVIESQDPEPGEQAARGSEISVALGGGVPDVVGMSQEEAEEALRSGGFEVEVATTEGAAGEVLEQSPSSGEEAGKGSTVAITVGEEAPAVEYAVIEEGPLTVEVPSDWESITGGDSEGGGLSWSSFTGGSVGASVTAAPDLAAWSTTTTTGAYIVASRALAQGFTNAQLTTTGPNDLSGSCTLGGAVDFERTPYAGTAQVWSDCGGNPDLYFYAIAAAPENRECVVVMQIGGFGVPEREIAQRISDSFEVDCAALAA